MKTYARLRPQDESMFSPEDSPARTLVSLDAVPGLAGNVADYGITTPVSLASFDPDTCSWRTCQGSLFGGWEEFSETWPRSGTTRSGTAYRLPPSVPHTYERGSSFWPTPIADSASGRTTPYSQGGVPLQVAVRWPTPTVQDSKNDGGPSQFERNTVPLNAAVKRWPTPNARDYKGAPGAGARARGGHQASLPGSLKDSEGSGSLNPTWVEWLMGCPLGWTDCGLSETASSLRSRSTSESGFLRLNG